MKIGFIGLGKMGLNMVENLLDHKYQVVAFDLNPDSVKQIAKKGAQTASSLKDVVNKLPSSKIIWLMVPAGKPVDAAIKDLLPLLKKGDILIDGGNSYYKDTLRRGEELAKKGIYFFDCGTSGGLEGARNGACMMIGGDKKTFKKIEKLFKDMCEKNGSGWVGKSGAGHFVKMVHNGVEYGMMQAIGEGFEVLDSSQFDLDLEDVARIWANGSVIRGWLMELTQSAFSKNAKLEQVSGEIADSGEGRWTVETAMELKVPVPVISEALQSRYRSKESGPISNRLVAALRDEFGGHGFKKKGGK